jgi:hypothetical protein
MKMYVPACGDFITLKKDWAFKLYHEGRNDKLWEQETGEDFYRHWREPTPPPIEVKIKKGTLLEIDRVYIRQHAKIATSDEDNYDSLSFKKYDEKGKTIRFWAKLSDVNTIEFDPAEIPEIRKKAPKIKPDDIKEMMKVLWDGDFSAGSQWHGAWTTYSKTGAVRAFGDWNEGDLSAAADGAKKLVKQLKRRSNHKGKKPSQYYNRHYAQFIFNFVKCKSKKNINGEKVKEFYQNNGWRHKNEDDYTDYEDKLLFTVYMDPENTRALRIEFEDIK